MATTQINQLPEGVAHPDSIVAADNPPRTRTEKITLSAIAALGGGPPALHALSHAVAGDDPISPESIAAAPAVHTHVLSDITDFNINGFVTSVNSRTGDITLTKSDVGLSQVDNTSDLDKPISDDTQDALDGKSDLGHTHTASSITDFNSAVLNVPKSFENISEDTAISVIKDIFFVNSTDNSVELTLPTAIGNGGREIKIKRSGGTNLVTVSAASLEFIDGQSSFSLYSMYESVTIVSNGISWFVV